MIRQFANSSSRLSQFGLRHRNLIPFVVPFAQNGTQCLRNLSCAARETPEDEDVPHDYFDILGIDRSFVISPQELKTKYKHLMKELHPDKHSSIHEPSCSSRTLEEEKALKTSMATDVTRAYGVIVNPLSRALHLLELWGAPIGEGDCSILGNNLLMEIMEIRENIENASTDEELRPLLDSCRSKRDDICDRLAEAFREERLDDARFLTAQLQYWNRIEETVLDKISHIH